jgi:hypothetical protein
MGTDVSPRGGARGRLAWPPASWMTDTMGAGLRRGRAAWAEHEREQQVHLINQLRASHSTLMVALLSQVVTPRTGPFGEVLQKNGLSPLEYHNIIIGITSSYHK